MYRLPTPAVFKPSPGACDCHVHVFGPFDRYPLVREGSYTLNPARLYELPVAEATST
jgi:hypothetical protein